MPLVLRVRSETAPARVTVQGAAVAYDYEASKKTVVVRVPGPATGPVTVVVTK